MTEEQNNPDQHQSQEEQLTFWQMFASTAAAAFGVQSRKNRERDFKQGKAIHFILVGVIFTALFVLAVAFVVSTVLSNVQ